MAVDDYEKRLQRPRYAPLLTIDVLCNAIPGPVSADISPGHINKKLSKRLKRPPPEPT